MQGLRPRVFRLNLKDNVPVKEGTLLDCVIIGYNEKHARGLAGVNAGVEGKMIWDKCLYTECTEIGHPNSNHNYPQVLCRNVHVIT